MTSFIIASTVRIFSLAKLRACCDTLAKVLFVVGKLLAPLDNLCMYDHHKYQELA